MKIFAIITSLIIGTLCPAYAISDFSFKDNVSCIGIGMTFGTASIGLMYAPEAEKIWAYFPRYRLYKRWEVKNYSIKLLVVKNFVKIFLSVGIAIAGFYLTALCINFFKKSDQKKLTNLEPASNLQLIPNLQPASNLQPVFLDKKKNVPRKLNSDTISNPRRKGSVPVPLTQLRLDYEALYQESLCNNTFYENMEKLNNFYEKSSASNQFKGANLSIEGNLQLPSETGHVCEENKPNVTSIVEQIGYLDQENQTALDYPNYLSSLPAHKNQSRILTDLYIHRAKLHETVKNLPDSSVDSGPSDQLKKNYESLGVIINLSLYTHATVPAKLDEYSQKFQLKIQEKFSQFFENFPEFKLQDTVAPLI